MKTRSEIEEAAQSIADMVESEYPDAGDEAILELAQAHRHLGWSESDVSELLAELGF